MAEISLGVIESRFADIIWERESVYFVGAGKIGCRSFFMEKNDDAYRSETVM